MRIGILGGTFDPIHRGHLALAQAAVTQLKLDRLYFVPTYQHPLEQKVEQKGRSASASDRLTMVKLAIQGEPKFLASDIEIQRKGVSYTVDTLREFRAQHPKPDELFFITGGDWGKNLDQWKEIDTIFSLAHFVVASRPGFDTKNLPQQAEVLDFTPLDISSTQIRQEIKKRKFRGDMLSDKVFVYIRQNKLYQF